MSGRSKERKEKVIRNKVLNDNRKKKFIEYNYCNKHQFNVEIPHRRSHTPIKGIKKSMLYTWRDGPCLLNLIVSLHLRMADWDIWQSEFCSNTQRKMLDSIVLFTVLVFQSILICFFFSLFSIKSFLVVEVFILKTIGMKIGRVNAKDNHFYVVFISKLFIIRLVWTCPNL